MISFLDGPAKELVRLRLGRAPYFLRVVRTKGTRRWDALDQLDDSARPEEEIFVYELASEPLRAFVRPGGLMISAHYKFCRRQPLDEDARDNTRWRHWCEQERASRIGPPDNEEETDPIDYGLDTGSQ
jgi:hypothetical protein